MSPPAELAAAGAKGDGYRKPLLPRLHLFELEDQPWFPGFLRDYATDYLRAMQEWMRVPSVIAPHLALALKQSGESRLVDLCSGGGGPMTSAARELRRDGLDVEVLLTDKYPNLRAFEQAAASDPVVTYLAEPVDAAAVPEDLTGLRTLFNSLHHFRPEQARAILANAERCGRPIAVFELSRRSLGNLSGMLLVPFFVLFVTPFLRPRRWGRLLWTYLPPLVPLICLWDGLVSQLRAYDERELLALTPPEGATFQWRAGRLGHGAVAITFLVGVPLSDETGKDSLTADGRGAPPAIERFEQVRNGEGPEAIGNHLATDSVD